MTYAHHQIIRIKKQMYFPSGLLHCYNVPLVLTVTFDIGMYVLYSLYIMYIMYRKEAVYVHYNFYRRC